VNKGLIHRVEAPIATAATPTEITNVVALFEALAVGWVEGSSLNRYLVAGDGIPFVRVNRPSFPNTGKPGAGDIPVVVLNHAYSMRGFIQHETRILYRGMFETAFDDEDRVWSAWLTAEGFRFAQAPVFDIAHLHHVYATCSFFNPSTKGPETKELERATNLAIGAPQAAPAAASTKESA